MFVNLIKNIIGVIFNEYQSQREITHKLPVFELAEIKQKCCVYLPIFWHFKGYILSLEKEL